MAVRIERVDVFSVRVPRKASFALHRGTTPSHSAFTLVKLTASSGEVGWGEAAIPFEPYAAIITGRLSGLLEGADPLDIAGAHRAMDAVEMMVMERLGFWNPARAAIDIALHDLAGKLLHLPVWKLLGSLRRRSIPTIKNVGVGGIEETGHAAEALVAEGYKSVKLRVGGDLELDARRVSAVFQRVGPAIRIRVDANQAWSVREAVEAASRMAPCGLESIEQPLRRLDLAGAAELRRRISVPIIADEGFWTEDEALLLLEHRAADVLHLYLSKCGGLLPASRIAALAASFGAEVTLGERVPLGICEAADAHLAAILPDLRFPCALSYDLNEHDLLRQSVPRERGALRVPEGEGLGIEVDEGRVGYYAGG